jgi:hypothetical protein
MILPSLQQSSSPRTWLFYGDSITHGVLHTAGARCFSEHFTERLRFELERPDDVVLNTACYGHNTRQMLSHFPLRVARFKPDVVLNQPFYAKDNIATAGGCFAAPYLAAWMIAKSAGIDAAKEALYYVAPVGEKEDYVARAMKNIAMYLA